MSARDGTCNSSSAIDFIGTAKQNSHYERFHIQNQKLQGSKLIFSMCISSFKEYVGTCSNEFNRLFGQDNIVRPLSIGTMIITTNDKWIIGRRLETHDYHGYYTLAAGYMNPDRNVIDFKPDPLCCYKERIERRDLALKKLCQ